MLCVNLLEILLEIFIQPIEKVIFKVNFTLIILNKFTFHRALPSAQLLVLSHRVHIKKYPGLITFCYGFLVKSQ